MTKRVPFSRKSQRIPQAPPIEWPRADPAALALFDERFKICTMNCGKAWGDPRTARERLFLCEDCHVINCYEVKA